MYLITLGIAPAVYSQSPRLTPNDRLDRGIEILRDSADSDAVSTALNDVVNLAHLKENVSELLSAVEACLARNTDNTTLQQKLILGKAQLLAKSGRWDEAKSLFDTAIREEYDKAASTYLECLTSIGKNKERAVEEYNLCVGKPTYLDYRGRQEDLSVFTTVLLLARGDDPEFSSMRDVFPYLVIDPKDETRLEITRALCLAADSQYEDSKKSSKRWNRGSRTMSRSGKPIESSLSTQPGFCSMKATITNGRASTCKNFTNAIPMIPGTFWDAFSASPITSNGSATCGIRSSR